MALLSSAPSYIMRLAPSRAKGNARCVASLDINQEYSRRQLHQRLLKSPKHASAMCSINSQSQARQAIRLVEISSFVEDAPLNIEVIHFASVTYVWHSPCISKYCRNVDSQIQQSMMSWQRSTTNRPVSSNPEYWRIHRDWRCLCRPFSLAGP